MSMPNRVTCGWPDCDVTVAAKPGTALCLSHQRKSWDAFRGLAVAEGPAHLNRHCVTLAEAESFLRTGAIPESRLQAEQARVRCANCGGPLFILNRTVTDGVGVCGTCTFTKRADSHHA